MTGTLNVTVTDGLGQPLVDVLVRAYSTLGVLGGEDRTDGSGDVSFTLAADDYKVHADPISPLYLPQWYGGGDFAVAPAIEVQNSATVNVDFLLVLPEQPSEVAQAATRVRPLFWYDTTADAALLLYPGEEKRFRDRQDDLYQHVLLGPFLTRVEAVAAGS